jgi:hypothetical protein
MTSANVNSIVAVREFKAALIRFAEEAASALDMMTSQIHRAVDWVEHERPAYWQQQVKVAFDEVAEARARLNTCQMRTVAGHRPSCIEEKQDYERAKRRLAYCQKMVPNVRRWAVKLRHEADEYRGRMGTLARAVEVDLPRMVALIERTATALEKYAEVAVDPATTDSGTASSTASTSSSSAPVTPNEMDGAAS